MFSRIASCQRHNLNITKLCLKVMGYNRYGLVSDLLIQHLLHEESKLLRSKK